MLGEPSESSGSNSAELDPVQQLRRWEDSGAQWRVIVRDGLLIVISLRRCDGGEEVAQLASSDPHLSAYVGDRNTSE